MTEQPAALWEHLVQWQPATAAAIAQHVRALPEDWPARTFGVARVDAALVLPSAATGEQFPDRAPEIAPYDEIASPDDCPACEESAGTCRFHAGYAAGHHEQAQALREAVKARPDIGLREFMLWQADVDEAEDRGEEPPVLPAAPAAVQPPADRAAIRDQLLDALDFAYCQGIGYSTPEELLAAYDAARPPADQAAETRRLALSQALGLGTSAPWDAIHDRAEELRRLVDEAQQFEAGPKQHRPVALATPCLNCGHPYNWHASRGACEAQEDACGCRKFAAGERPTPIDPRRILGINTDRTTDEAQQPRPRRCPSCGHQICDGDGPCGAILSVGVITERRCTCTGPGSPADEAQQDAPPREPHPTQADMDTAVAVLAKFQGRDTDDPAAGARQPKEA